MQLSDEFTVPVAPDRAYASLLDLPLVAECAARIKQVDIEDFLAIVHANSQRLFFPR